MSSPCFFPLPALLSETSVFFSSSVPQAPPLPPLVFLYSALTHPETPFPAGPVMAENDVDNELLDYEDDEWRRQLGEMGLRPLQKDVKGSYVSIHSSGFRDFLLKPELLRAIVDCGFEHPSEGKFPVGHGYSFGVLGYKADNSYGPLQFYI